MFVYLFIFEVTTTKLSFRFYKQCSQAVTRLIRERAIFAQNASIVAVDKDLTGSSDNVSYISCKI